MNKVKRSIFEKINRGIATGLNEAFIINEETKNKLMEEDKKSA